MKRKSNYFDCRCIGIYHDWLWQFNRNFSIGINSGKQTGYPVYD